MNEVYTSNKRPLVHSIFLLICSIIVLFVGVFVILMEEFAVVSIIVVAFALICVLYLTLDSFLYYKNFELTLTDKEISVKTELGKTKTFKLSDKKNIYISRLRSGPIIVLGEEKYFVYGSKIKNFVSLTGHLESMDVLKTEDVVKANRSSVEMLKDSWGRGKSK